MRRSGAEPAGVALTIHMSDDSGIGLLLAAFVDVLLGEGARRSRWIRVLKYTASILFLGVVALAIYVTVRYS
jgi:hypothetical protein